MTAPRTAVIWSRVSSKEQEQGFSPEAQVDICNDYAERQNFKVVKTWKVAESAKTSGVRAHFDEMIEFLSADHAPKILLVEKTDRLSRNEEDFFSFKPLVKKGLEIHRVKEGVSSAKSSPGEWLLFKQMMVFAEYHNVDLSDKVRKGSDALAARGLYPQKAPAGYVHMKGKGEGLKPDPEVAPLVVWAFEQYATGNYSLAQLARLVSERGLRSRFGRAVAHSGLHRILQNPLYFGEFDWRGARIKGVHPALISRDLFDRVADQLHRVKGKPHEEPRKASKYQRRRHTYAGVMTCPHCGGAVVGELQHGHTGKGNYVYYHCRKRCEQAVREERLTEQFTAELWRLDVDELTFMDVVTRIRTNHAGEEKYHAEKVELLTADRKRIDQQLHRLLDLHIDGGLSRADYDAKTAGKREEQDRIDRELAAETFADRGYADTAVRVFELARRAQSLFVAATPEEKRKIVRLMCLNPILRGGKVETNFHEPFESLASAVASAKIQSGGEGVENGLHPSWLGD